MISNENPILMGSYYVSLMLASYVLALKSYVKHMLLLIIKAYVDQLFEQL